MPQVERCEPVRALPQPAAGERRGHLPAGYVSAPQLCLRACLPWLAACLVAGTSHLVSPPPAVVLPPSSLPAVPPAFTPTPTPQTRTTRCRPSSTPSPWARWCARPSRPLDTWRAWPRGRWAGTPLGRAWWMGGGQPRAMRGLGGEGRLPTGLLPYRQHVTVPPPPPFSLPCPAGGAGREAAVPLHQPAPAV